MVNVELQNNKIKILIKDLQYYRDLRDYFTFYVDSYQFMPMYRSGMWDGKTCLFNFGNKTLPYGLITDFLKFHKSKYRNLKLNISKDVSLLFKGPKLEVKYDLKFEPRDYQIDCVEEALSRTKGIFRLSTGSGKSYIITLILKTLYEQKISDQQIIIVPTQSLVEQFHSDMIDYGINKHLIGKVYSKYKEWDYPYVIATWQTLTKNIDKLPLYNTVVADEAHGTKAFNLSKILKKSPAKYRFGFTGTLHSNKLDNLNVKSYIGPILREYSFDVLSKQNYLSKCNVNIINLAYNTKFEGTFNDFKDQIFWNNYRLDLISNIVNKMDHNILILVGRVEKEGEILEDHLKKCIKNKEIVFLSGRDKTDLREYWRNECEKRKDIVLIATYGIFQLGINIPSLKYLILSAPFKSKIRVLQSIGRTLRLHAEKLDGASIYDILDMTKYFEKQGFFRKKYYQSEGFNINEFDLKENDNFDKIIL